MSDWAEWVCLNFYKSNFIHSTPFLWNWELKNELGAICFALSTAVQWNWWMSESIEIEWSEWRESKQRRPQQTAKSIKWNQMKEEKRKEIKFLLFLMSEWIEWFDWAAPSLNACVGCGLLVIGFHSSSPPFNLLHSSINQFFIFSQLIYFSLMNDCWIV